jgi:predicted nucleotidyltransferase
VISEHALAEAARGTGIRMLALFGSRARGEAHPGSDWDFGYLAADGGGDIELLRSRLSQVLDTDAIDLVDLVRAGALLRTRAGAEGTVLFESEPGIFLAFQDEVARFWCDVEPVLTRAYASILAKAGTR